MTRKVTTLMTILWIGLIAGTLDIADNLIFNQFRGISPIRVFQYIASGLIGMKSFQLGLASVALGVLIHYTIALFGPAFSIQPAESFRSCSGGL